MCPPSVYDTFAPAGRYFFDRQTDLVDVRGNNSLRASFARVRSVQNYLARPATLVGTSKPDSMEVLQEKLVASKGQEGKQPARVASDQCSRCLSMARN